MDDIKLRNLEMIQQLVTRMAQNSFVLKGWSVTIVAAAFSINGNANALTVYLLIYFITIMFWLLDSYYLSLERGYRKLYSKCLEEEGCNFDFKLQDQNLIKNYILCIFSKVEFGFYFLLLLMVSIILYTI